MEFHEHRRKNHNWPNLEGKVLMDSKLIFNKKLNYWTFVWVYGMLAFSIGFLNITAINLFLIL